MTGYDAMELMISLAFTLDIIAFMMLTYDMVGAWRDARRAKRRLYELEKKLRLRSLLYKLGVRGKANINDYF